MAEEKKNFKELNHWVGMGRLSAAPTFTQKGETKVAKFAIAVNNGTDTPDWIDCVCFSNTAQFVNDHLDKGAKVVVEGRLSTSMYEDKEGVKRKSVNIVARYVSFAESKRNIEGSEEVDTKESEVEQKEDFSIPESFVPTDDEMPFK